ncbi:MAG: hypothetical protein OXH78_00295, partial [Acidimicrobiaceae bacterium]|nr:hypothetical protein [Acidimicrobiaceae bacterium]
TGEAVARAARERSEQERETLDSSRSGRERVVSATAGVGVSVARAALGRGVCSRRCKGRER